MSSTSFSAGPVGERKPELSTTQLEQFISPVVSASVLGLKLSFGEDTAFDGPASLGPALAEAETGVSCRRAENADIHNNNDNKNMISVV